MEAETFSARLVTKALTSCVHSPMIAHKLQLAKFLKETFFQYLIATQYLIQLFGGRPLFLWRIDSVNVYK